MLVSTHTFYILYASSLECFVLCYGLDEAHYMRVGRIHDSHAVSHSDG
jgi:hypothetical protein